MDYRIDPAKLNAQFKACFLGNAPVSGISRASSDTTGVAPVSVASFEQHSNVSTPVLVPQSYEHNSINPAHMSHYHLPTQAQHSAAAHIEPTSLQRPEVGYVSPSYQNFDTVPQNQSQYSQQQNPHLMSVESMSRQQGYPPPMQIEHMPNRQEYSNAMPVESIHSQQGYPQSVPMESVPYQQHQPGPQGYHPAPHQTNPYGAQYPMQTSYPDQSMYPMGHPPQPGLKSEPDLIVVLDRQTPSRHEEVPPSPQFSNKDFVSRSEGVRAGGRRAAGLETFDFDAPGTPPRSSGPPTLEYEDRTDAHRRSYDYSSEFPVTGPTSDLPRSRTRDRHGSGSDSHTGSSWMSDEENPRSYKSGRRAKGGSSRSYSRSPIRDKEREPRALRRCERSRSPNVRDSRRSLRDRSRSPRRRSKSPHERRRRRSQSPVSRDRRRSRSPVVRDRRRSPIFRERRRSRSPVVRERRRSPQRQTSANTANTETPAPQQRKKNGILILIDFG